MLESKIYGFNDEEIELIEPKEDNIKLKPSEDASWIHGELHAKVQVKSPMGEIIDREQALSDLPWVSHYNWYLLSARSAPPREKSILPKWLNDDTTHQVYSPSSNTTDTWIVIYDEYFKKPGEYIIKLQIHTKNERILEVGKKINLIW